MPLMVADILSHDKRQSIDRSFTGALEVEPDGTEFFEVDHQPVADVERFLARAAAASDVAGPVSGELPAPLAIIRFSGFVDAPGMVCIGRGTSGPARAVARHTAAGVGGRC